MFLEPEIVREMMWQLRVGLPRIHDSGSAITEMSLGFRLNLQKVMRCNHAEVSSTGVALIRFVRPALKEQTQSKNCSRFTVNDVRISSAMLCKFAVGTSVGKDVQED